MRPFEPLSWEELPDTAKALMPREAPVSSKMIAARAMLPMGTKDLVSVLFYLAGEEEQRIRGAARKSLMDLPKNLLMTALVENISPKIMHWFANRNLPEPSLYELIALNRFTADETIAFLAAKRQEPQLLNIISENQERLLRHLEIVAALFNNPASPVELRERIRSFVELTTGKSIEEITRRKPAAEPAPASEAFAAEKLPDETLSDETSPDDLDAVPDEELPPDLDVDKLAQEVFEEETSFSNEFLVDPEEDLTSGQRVTMANRIRKMKVLDKMRLALVGNIEARQLLVKSSNKLIQECVLRNPRMTVEEVIRVAKDKTMREELIRLVTLNKEWIKNYQVVYQLCWNPKTPIVAAMKYLARLNVKDLVQISKSKQVPGMLAVQAKKMVEAKQKYN